jgi:hypothetical protein
VLSLFDEARGLELKGRVEVELKELTHLGPADAAREISFLPSKSYPRMIVHPSRGIFLQHLHGLCNAHAKQRRKMSAEGRARIRAKGEMGEGEERLNTQTRERFPGYLT